MAKALESAFSTSRSTSWGRAAPRHSHGSAPRLSILLRTASPHGAGSASGPTWTRSSSSLNANKQVSRSTSSPERGRQMFEEMVKGPTLSSRTSVPAPWSALGDGGHHEPDGSWDRPPVRIEAGLGDTGSGLHAAIGSTALVQRQVTGVGQRVEVAQQDVVVNHAHPLPRAPSRRAPHPPTREWVAGRGALEPLPRRPFGPEHYVSLHVANTDMWKALARAIGQPQLPMTHASRNAAVAWRRWRSWRRSSRDGPGSARSTR